MKIEKYINYIRQGNIDEYVYSGDGEGEDEREGNLTTSQCLVDYIAHCQAQEKLAMSALSAFYD